MTELWFDPDADAALTALESDSSRKDLTQRVNDVLDQLESDPGHVSVRRHRFHQPALWCVTVVSGSEEWAILWEPHPDEAAAVVVRYLGLASFD